MKHTVLSTAGTMKCHCVRLRRGDDLMGSVKALCQEQHIAAGVVLSAVGCISQGRVRDASGVNIREICDLKHPVRLVITLGYAREGDPLRKKVRKDLTELVSYKE